MKNISLMIHLLAVAVIGQAGEGVQKNVPENFPEGPGREVISSIFDEPEESFEEVEEVPFQDGELPLQGATDADQEVGEVRVYFFTINPCGACDRQKERYFPRWREADWKIGPEETNHIRIIEEGTFPEVWSRFGVSRQTHSMPYWIVTVDGVIVDRMSGVIQNASTIAEYYKAAPEKLKTTEKAFAGIGNIEIEGFREPYANAVGIMSNLLGGEWKPNEKITISAPKELNIRITQPKRGEVLIEFLGERPRVSALGGWISPKISAIRCRETEAVAELAGFPDFTFIFKD